MTPAEHASVFEKGRLCGINEAIALLEKHMELRFQ